MTDRLLAEQEFHHLASSLGNRSAVFGPGTSVAKVAVEMMKLLLGKE